MTEIKDLKIIVCDDSKLARKVVEKALVGVGVNPENIRLCATGDIAIQSYKESRPDLVLLDIVMPGKTGKDILTEIKDIDTDAKVIMISSVGTSKNIKDTLKAGATDFIQKPIDDKNLKEALNKVIIGGKSNV